MATQKDRPDAAAALAKRAQNGNGAPVATTNLIAAIRGMESQFALAMPRGTEASQLIRDALTAVRMTKHLAECDPASVFGALMTCAQLGLRPGVLGHAWLIPFKDWRTKQYKAQLVIGYQGLAELAHRSGRVASLIARTVHKNDTFDVDYGVADTLIHKPVLFEDRGDPIAYYAIVKTTAGGHAFYVMSHREMESYRDKHATARDKNGKIFGPWVDHFEPMAHKTCMRQLAKWMPKSADLAIAIAADGGVRVDLTPTLDAAETTEHPDVIDGLAVDQPADPDAAAAGLTQAEIDEHNAALRAEAEADR